MNEFKQRIGFLLGSTVIMFWLNLGIFRCFVILIIYLKDISCLIIVLLQHSLSMHVFFYDRHHTVFMCRVSHSEDRRFAPLRGCSYVAVRRNVYKRTLSSFVSACSTKMRRLNIKSATISYIHPERTEKIFALFVSFWWSKNKF